MNKEKAANITNLTLGSIMSMDDIVVAYFSNDSDRIVKAIATNVKDADSMFKALETANYEIENAKALGGKSNYGYIQSTIVSQIVTPTNVSFLETNLINDERIIGEQCPQIESAKNVLMQVKQQNLGVGMTR